MFLIDTCVISELAKPSPDQNVKSYLSELNSLTVSTMTIQELAYGIKKNNSQKLHRWFAELLPQLEVIATTKEISLLAADFQARLGKKGVILADADAIIAATASITGRILVTRNIKDFANCGVTLRNPFV